MAIHGDREFDVVNIKHWELYFLGLRISGSNSSDHNVKLMCFISIESIHSKTSTLQAARTRLHDSFERLSFAAA
jgi:hypothetical protein